MWKTVHPRRDPAGGRTSGCDGRLSRSWDGQRERSESFKVENLCASAHPPEGRSLDVAQACDTRSVLGRAGALRHLSGGPVDSRWRVYCLACRASVALQLRGQGIGRGTSGGGLLGVRPLYRQRRSANGRRTPLPRQLGCRARGSADHLSHDRRGLRSGPAPAESWRREQGSYRLGRRLRARWDAKWLSAGPSRGGVTAVEIRRRSQSHLYGPSGSSSEAGPQRAIAVECLSAAAGATALLGPCPTWKRAANGTSTRPRASGPSRSRPPRYRLRRPSDQRRAPTALESCTTCQ
jgi:hypothetical protein